jgi:hypothetical protein
MSLPKQTINTQRDSSDIMRRRIIRDAVPKQMVRAQINGNARRASSSRAWEGSDDYLARRNYICGGSSASANVVGPTAPFARMFRAANQNCDGSNVAGSNCDPRFVPDAASFANFRALQTIAQVFNE